MSQWNHSICPACWRIREPLREPVVVMGEEKVKCCFCGKETAAGIYVREHPKNPALKGCRGEHAEES